MNKRFVPQIKTLILSLAVAAASSAYAAYPNADAIKRQLESALPSFIGADNTALVEKMHKPFMGDPLSISFNFEKAVSTIFVDGKPTVAADCQRTKTSQGEADEGDCNTALGKEAGAGAYTRLSYSKNLGFGNISFISRGPVGAISPEKLVPVNIDDTKAFEMAGEIGRAHV
jgi:hypothetical protein